MMRLRSGFGGHFAGKNWCSDCDARGTMILVLIQILITVVIGAILFWLIDRFIRDRRLANLLKILVVLLCLASILQRLLPMAGMGF
jgi:hypothetical protein